MQDALNRMIAQFEAANAGNYLWFVYAAALLYLLIFEREKRKMIAVPSLILTVLILNPGTVWILGRLHVAYVYWRVFWLVPVIPVTACAVVCLAGRIRPLIGKGLLAIGCTALVLFAGVSVYKTEGNEFIQVANNFKIRQYAAEVAHDLLEYDSHPRVVATAGLATHLRMYSTDIELMYGRDIGGFMGEASETAQAVSDEVYAEYPDLDFIREAMREGGYTYLVRRHWDSDDPAAFAEEGFVFLESVWGYDLYRTE